MSDASFLARFLPQYADWREQPGATDEVRLMDLARQLGLASDIVKLRDYDQVRAEHAAGRQILVQTEHAPAQALPVSKAQRYTMVLVEMNVTDFTVWCPYASGLSDTLPRAPRIWWERWQAAGLVLDPTARTGSAA